MIPPYGTGEGDTLPLVFLQSCADGGLEDSGQLILFGSVDMRLLADLSWRDVLELQRIQRIGISTASKTGVAVQSTECLEIPRAEGWSKDHCTMPEFQRRICALVGVPVEQQLLTYGMKELRAGRTLGSYGIKEEASVHLANHLSGGGGQPESTSSTGFKQAPDSRMQVFVAGFRSGTITLDVKPSEDLQRLKEAIFEREGVPLSEQRLTLGEKDLEHGKTLASYGIEKECTMHLRLRGRGGGQCIGRDVDRPVTEPLEFDNSMPNVMPEAAAGVAAGGSGTPAPQAAAGAPEMREPDPPGAAAGATFARRAVEQAPSAALPSPVVQEAEPRVSGAVSSSASPDVQVRVPAEQKERPDSLKTAIVFGRLDNPALRELFQSLQPAKTIRVFLSSTFTDTAEERNRILKAVVPKLQALFAKYGYEFQASEMRWSIGKEVCNSHSPNICTHSVVCYALFVYPRDDASIP